MSTFLRTVGPRSRANALFFFIMHQFVGTLGIGFFAYALGVSSIELAQQLGGHVSINYLYWILTETPFYPIQIALGLYFGWLLGHRLRQRSMIWVWILPSMILCFAVATNFTFIPEWTSVLARTGAGQSRLSHYFGWGCRPSIHCFDQLVITMPFYISAAYSVGGRLGITRAGR